MKSDPDSSIGTRKTLLDRLKTPDDQDAWQEFDRIYRPFILKVARRMGLNEDDASDVAQETMVEVNKFLPRFVYQPERARFRTWLFKIARNRVMNHFRDKTRQPVTVPPNSPDERHTDLVERMPDPSSTFDQIWSEEWERSLTRRALDQLRPVLKPRHYQIAFEIFVNWRSPAEVAQRLQLSTANVHLVKHRVGPRLRKALPRSGEWL